MNTISVFYCLLYATWAEGASINVKGFERGDVSFQCSHRLAWKNNKYLCKNPCKVNGDILVTVQSGRRAESGRITLVDLGNGVFNVTFSQLQLSDSGRYMCAVDRPGYDTFTNVYLTVEEAVPNETTVIPELSPTWTYQNISSSTQLTSGMDSSKPTNLSTDLNCTNGGEQSISTGTVLYATVGCVATLSILVLAAGFRKHRKHSKPQPQVCSNSTVLINADESKADREHDEGGEKLQSVNKLSERFSCPHHPKQEPATSASTAADSVSLHIYENLCCSKATADSRSSAANKHDTSSQVYITPLPPIISKGTGDGCLVKHTKTCARHATSKPTESRTNNASACHSRPCSDSNEMRPRSLWFGLDISGIV